MTPGSDLEAIANMPQKIKIGDKEYEIKSPCIGIASQLARKMREILELMNFDIAAYDRQKTTLETLVFDIVKGLYRLLMSEHMEEAIDIICEILALLINNKPLNADNLVITPEEIKWNLSINELLPFLIRVIRMADLSDFFVLLLQTAQVYDIEGILSAFPNSSSQLHKPQAGQSNT